MSLLDPFILEIDKALRTVFVSAPTIRPVPGEDLPEADMTEEERRHAAALMRVNHVGEVCAQGLYAGQACVARKSSARLALEQAAWEETEHLNWTERRIGELGGRKSLVNPVWYAGAWVIGALAGCAGDRISLGFVAETERQVEAHLLGHMEKLPRQDMRSRAIVSQMKADEVAHARMAERHGAAELPVVARQGMRLAAKVMTGTAYRV